MIKKIDNKEEKEKICIEVLEALPEWFEIPESRASYAKESRELPFWADVENNIARTRPCWAAFCSISCRLAGLYPGSMARKVREKGWSVWRCSSCISLAKTKESLPPETHTAI